MKIENPGPIIHINNIKELEIRVGKLPEDYQKFLLDYNGGQPSPDCIDVTNLPGSPTDIQILFGIGRDIESCDLLSVVREHKHLVSQGILPIASDSGGNLFGLVLRGDDLEKIVYLDIGNMTKTQYYVASNFSEFVGKFRKFI